MERKLITILAADVVGYAAHMERDEKGTHERLVAGRKELFEPEIALHHGRVFKLMGDGMLAEFGSVVDAVECAVSIQRGLAERNAEVAEDQRIQVRIGINLGEVIVEGDDRFGEGVNIAARLEQIADPGGVCVSGKVAREVEKKLAFGFEPMGAHQVKNITEPVLVAKDSWTLADCAQFPVWAGRPDRGIAWLEEAVRREANPPDWYLGNLAIAYYVAGRPDDAVVQFLKMKEPWRTNLIAAYVSAGKLNEAQALMAEFRKDYPDYTLKDDAVWPTGKTPQFSETVLKPYLADLAASFACPNHRLLQGVSIQSSSLRSSGV